MQAVNREPKTEGDVKEMARDWFLDRDGWSYAPVQNGLGVHGIHDRVGVVPVLITPDMVGRKIGAFVSIECKAPGRRGEPRRGLRMHQLLVGEKIREAYGLTVVCDGQEDLDRLDDMFKAPRG